jgi:hypothetical protein
MAASRGIELGTEEQYQDLQRFGNFDTKTSSWSKPSAAVRKLGGGLFGKSPIRPCLCVSQRGTVLLRRPGAFAASCGLRFRNLGPVCH